MTTMDPDESLARALPVLESGRYVFRAGATELVVDPSLGGRVLFFGVAGRNVLTGPEVVAAGPDALPNMYGSTFWTSPQSSWGWPPESEIDSEPHETSLCDGALCMRSQPGSTTGYGVNKRVWLRSEGEVASIEYELVNHRATAPAAPWEISRVSKRGLVFFPSEVEAEPQSTLSSVSSGGVFWIDVARAPAGDSKLFQDGSEGWLAHLDGDLAFIKLFEDVSADEQAPGEAEIEVFVSGDYDYVEIEQQGRYESVPAGGSSRWRVSWLLRRTPPGLDTSLGSEGLVSWVRGQVADVSPGARAGSK